MDKNIVINDYMFFNKYCVFENKKVIEVVVVKIDNKKVIDGMIVVMEVCEFYINVVFDEIDVKYGLMDNFLKEKFGLIDVKKE